MRKQHIGVEPITQYTHVRNKNSNTHGSSSDFQYLKELLLKERSCSQNFSLRKVPILKRDVIVENHLLVQ